MLTEISLNVIDIARNSVRAEASLVEIAISVNSHTHELTLRISDDGKGMTPEQLASVEDPFFTSRKTRSVGLGIPFLKQAAEITGGTFHIDSQVGVGTNVIATFRQDNIDCMPLGDINSSIHTLVTSTSEEIDYLYTYEVDGRSFSLDTREFKEIVQGVPLYEPEISSFIRSFLDENKREVDGKTEEEN
ncbi:MAG: ATP-binding protein [Mogibacterium sp.]|nr:ATP-binding protein [Mogibacterium sp.]